MSRLLRLAVLNRWGRLVTITTVLVLAVVLGREFLGVQVYRPLRQAILTGVGYGFIPMSVWLALAVLVARLRLGWFAEKWRWWLSAVLLIGAAQTVMGAIHGSLGVTARETLGGRLGQTLWGGTPLQGIPVVMALVLLAALAVSPHRVGRLTLLGLLLTSRYVRITGRVLRTGVVFLLRVAVEGGVDVARFATAGLRSARRKRREAVADGTPGVWEDRPGVDLHPPIESLYSEGTRVLSRRQQERPAGVASGGTEGVFDLESGNEDENVGERTGFAGQSVGEQSSEWTAPQGASRSLQAGVAWQVPPLPLMDYGPEVESDQDETSETASRIEESLRSHNIDVEVTDVKPGPTVTLYGLSPGWVEKVREVKERDEDGNVVRDGRGRPVVRRKKERTRVRVDSIVAREKDLALALATPSLRIQAPVPGEAIVGIEVPNANPALVSLRSVLESGYVQEIASKRGLALALGEGSGGEPVVTNLRKLPHLLIAGATGSGKSVCINTIIVSLVTQVSPEHLRMLLIDPKRVELTPFNGLPHLVAPVVVDTEQAVNALRGMLREMLRRYRVFEELGVRNIEACHRHPGVSEPMPYLVIAVDELADLMMSDAYNVERTLTRLAQLGRATGIHLVVATQRPSVDVVTGLIKANFPSRISFAVVSQVDSRTILDMAGAERLLGKGDMLFLSTDMPRPQRVQGAYLSDREIARVVEFWQNQQGPPLPAINLDPEPEQESDRAGVTRGEHYDNAGSTDDLLDQAIELAGRHRSISTSLLQRRLRIGYPRAARLMDQLEDEGVIGPGEPGKPREVYVSRE